MHTNFSFIIASMNQMNIHYFLLLAYIPWLYFDINLWCFHCPRVKGTCGWKQIYSIHAKFNFFVVLCKLYQDLRVTPWAKPWYNLHNTTKQLKMYRISITKFAHLHPLFFDLSRRPYFAIRLLWLLVISDTYFCCFQHLVPIQIMKCYSELLTILWGFLKLIFFSRELLYFFRGRRRFLDAKI